MKRLCLFILLAIIAFMCTYTLAEEAEIFLTPLDGIRFPAGDKYPVYYGPGYGYDRMADGKASVSTNGWIRVYGEETGTVLDRHGSPGASILIEYEITEGRHRFGWVASADLPDSVSVWQQLSWQWGYAHTNQTTSVTDDPFYSQTGVATLSAGTDVQVLLEIGDWTYIDAPPIRGFVPSSSLTEDAIPYQDDPDLVQVVQYFENTGIKGYLSGLHHSAFGHRYVYFSLENGGTAEYFLMNGGFSLYEMNWDFEGVCDDDLALFLDYYLGLLADVQNGRSLEEHLHVGYNGELGQRNIDAVISNGTFALEFKGEQWLRVLLAQLAAHDGNDQLNSLRAIAASRMLGKLDATPVDPSAGCAWYDALTLANQDDLPPVDAAIYEENPTYRVVTQALIAHYEEERASWGSRRDVDSTKTCVIVTLDVHKVRETEDKLILWASVAENEYALYDGNKYQNVSGSWVPSRITMEKNDNGQWMLAELIRAEDGTLYEPSIIDFCGGDKNLARKLMAGGGGKSCEECFLLYLTTNGYTGPFEVIPY